MDIEETAAAYRRAMMFKRKSKDAPDLELLTILKNDLDWHNAELWKAATEIDRLRDLVRQLEAERDQWQRQAVNNG